MGASLPCLVGKNKGSKSFDDNPFPSSGKMIFDLRESIAAKDLSGFSFRKKHRPAPRRRALANFLLLIPPFQKIQAAHSLQGILRDSPNLRAAAES
jgi:hypothetical protein